MTQVDPAPRATIVLLTGGRAVRLGTVPSSASVDLLLVDVLLRMQLAAIREGSSIRLTDVHPRLLELIELVGAANQLTADPDPDPERDPGPELE